VRTFSTLFWTKEGAPAGAGDLIPPKLQRTINHRLAKILNIEETKTNEQI
jgi:hypothetical protein